MGIVVSDIGHTRVTLRTVSSGGEEAVAFSAVNPDGTAAAGPLTPVATAAVAGSQIAKASAGKLYGFNVGAGASAGYVMIFDSATVPASPGVTWVHAVALEP